MYEKIRFNLPFDMNLERFGESRAFDEEVTSSECPRNRVVENGMHCEGFANDG